MKIVTCPGGGESHKNGHLSRWGGGCLMKMVTCPGGLGEGVVS